MENKETKFMNLVKKEIRLQSNSLKTKASILTIYILNRKFQYKHNDFIFRWVGW